MMSAKSRAGRMAGTAVRAIRRAGSGSLPGTASRISGEGSDASVECHYFSQYNAPSFLSPFTSGVGICPEL